MAAEPLLRVPLIVVRDDWSRCPNCGKRAIEGGSVDITDTGAVQECWCTECNWSWREVYRQDKRIELEGP